MQNIFGSFKYFALLCGIKTTKNNKTMTTLKPEPMKTTANNQMILVGENWYYWNKKRKEWTIDIKTKTNEKL